MHLILFIITLGIQPTSSTTTVLSATTRTATATRNATGVMIREHWLSIVDRVKDVLKSDDEEESTSDEGEPNDDYNGCMTTSQFEQRETSPRANDDDDGRSPAKQRHRCESTDDDGDEREVGQVIQEQKPVVLRKSSMLDMFRGGVRSGI